MPSTTGYWTDWTGRPRCSGSITRTIGRLGWPPMRSAFAPETHMDWTTSSWRTAAWEVSATNGSAAAYPPFCLTSTTTRPRCAATSTEGRRQAARHAVVTITLLITRRATTLRFLKMGARHTESVESPRHRTSCGRCSNRCCRHPRRPASHVDAGVHCRGASRMGCGSSLSSSWTSLRNSVLS
jgi:hypothetical protein